jgi:hypothetical protein
VNVAFNAAHGVKSIARRDAKKRGAGASEKREAPKSRSRLINNAIQTEFFGGGHWQRVVSTDGVVTDVTRLWPMKAGQRRGGLS